MLLLQATEISTNVQKPPKKLSPDTAESFQLTCFMDRKQRRRRRPALSCLECRRRKIKCDRNEPCTHCVSAKLQCTYKFYADTVVDVQQSLVASTLPSTVSPSASAPSSGVARSRHESSAMQTTHNRHHNQVPQYGPETPLPENHVHPWGPRATEAARDNDQPNTAALRHKVNDSAIHDHENNEHQPQNVTTKAPGHHEQRQNEDGDVQASLQSLMQRVRKLEQSSAGDPAHALSETTQDIIASRSGLGGSRTMLDKSRMLRWSHWMGTAPEVSMPYCNGLGDGDDERS